MMRRRSPAKAVTLLAFAALATVACATRSVDLGENSQLAVGPKADASTDTGANRLYGCTEWLDDEISSVRGPACSGTCGANLGSDRFAVANMKDVVAVTAGRWMFCGRSPFVGLSDVIGVEFTPGCRIYALRKDSQGRVVRGTDSAYQASFDISAPEGDTPELDLHFSAERTVRYYADATRCPDNVLRLTSTEGTLTMRPVTREDEGLGPTDTPGPEF
jgi:hypothetical protein